MNMSLAEVSKKMRDIDFAVLFTRASNGALAGRPMSNNGEVEYEGVSYFFAYAHTRTAQDIEHDATVALSYTGAKGLLGKPPIFITIEGTASLVRDKTQFAAHWTKGLERWFPQGVDTAGLVLIKVQGNRIHYWDGENDGEIIPIAGA